MMSMSTNAKNSRELCHSTSSQIDHHNDKFCSNLPRFYSPRTCSLISFGPLQLSQSQLRLVRGALFPQLEKFPSDCKQIQFAHTRDFLSSLIIDQELIEEVFLLFISTCLHPAMQYLCSWIATLKQKPQKESCILMRSMNKLEMDNQSFSPRRKTHQTIQNWLIPHLLLHTQLTTSKTIVEIVEVFYTKFQVVISQVLSTSDIPILLSS